MTLVRTVCLFDIFKYYACLTSLEFEHPVWHERILTWVTMRLLADMQWLGGHNACLLSFIRKFWGSCTQSSYISKFLEDFCKIHRAHTALSRSKMYEAQNLLKKKISVSLEEDFIFEFPIYFSASFAFYFLISYK